jgi:hypothetical protein
MIDGPLGRFLVNSKEQFDFRSTLRTGEPSSSSTSS